RVIRLGGSYDVVDGLDGVNLFDMQLSRGLDFLNASKPGSLLSRTGGESEFTKIAGDFSRTKALFDGFSLATTASGQYSPDQLLVPEQYLLGGAAFGSAYDPAELSGDYGASAKAELRY